MTAPAEQLVEVVIPVHDEEVALRPNVELLLDHLGAEFPFRHRVVVADNASSDRTPLVAAELARRTTRPGSAGSSARAAGLARAPPGSARSATARRSSSPQR